MANPAQEASLADLLSQAGIPIDPMSGNGDTPPSSATPAPSQPVAAMQSNDQVDPTTGAPLAPDAPAMPEVAQTMIGRIRQSNPDAADQSDFQLARSLYTQGMHRPNEAFPQFATRMGIQMGAGETFSNEALTNAALHLNQPIEAAAAGVGGMFGGDGWQGAKGFGDAFGAKMQELRDQEDVGSYQHPNASGLGDMAGTAAGFVGAPGKLIAKGAEAVPGLRVVAKTPLGSDIVKMGGLSGANEAVPNIQDAANHPDGFSWGDLLADESGSVIKGMAAAVAGKAAAKLGTTVVAPLARSIAGGVDSAESVLRGLPRTLYSQGADKMAAFRGAADNPATQALANDTKYYTDLLSKAGINVGKGVSDLTSMGDQPGFAPKIADAMENSFKTNGPPPAPPKIDLGPLPDPKLQKLFDIDDLGPPDELRVPPPRPPINVTHVGIFDGGTDTLPPPRQLPPDLGGLPPLKPPGPPSPPTGGQPRFDDFSDPAPPNIGATLQQHLAALRQDDPSGATAQRYIADIYKQLIPQRLAGSFDPEAAFGSKAGQVGKLIQPPLSGPLDKMGQAWFERSGGGPGRVMWPLINQPKAAVGGAASIAANLAGLGGKATLGTGAKVLGGAADALGAPGDYLLKMLGNQAQPGAHSAIGAMPGMWQNYLNTELGNRGQQANPLDTVFPDIYHAPAPVSQPSGTQHSEVMQWLGNAPRQTAMAYIGSKLGPQVQQQLASAGDNWKAALFNLASDPKSRAALTPSEEA